VAPAVLRELNGVSTARMRAAPMMLLCCSCDLPRGVCMRTRSHSQLQTTQSTKISQRITLQPSCSAGELQAKTVRWHGHASSAPANTYRLL
jgi:hypothetical protein